MTKDQCCVLKHLTAGDTGDVGKFISSRLEALQSGVSLDCDKIYARLSFNARLLEF